MPANATRYPAGLRLPECAAIRDGSPKMLDPIMVLSINAAKLQRPRSRTSPPDDCGVKRDSGSLSLSPQSRPAPLFLRFRRERPACVSRPRCESLCALLVPAAHVPQQRKPTIISEIRLCPSAYSSLNAPQHESRASIA